MSSEKMIFGSRDLISGLPDCLISHILSFIPTKEAASTSVLAKKWRYLFVLTPNLEFDNRKITFPWITKKKSKNPRSFVDFVDRVLVLHQNVPLNRFSLKCKDVNPAIVTGWILKVLDRGVSDLNLQISTTGLDCLLPSEIFVSETLVSLKIGVIAFLTTDMNNVFLPKVKTLCLDCVVVSKKGFAKLLSGCPTLDEVVLNNWLGECSIANITVKRLSFHRSTFDLNHMSVSFDTPNLVYLEYFDAIAHKYPKVNFNSLVEACLDLRMTSDQIGKAKISNDDRSVPEEMVVNATYFVMGICNVKILDLSGDTLEVLTYCCKPMPKFNNLIHLTIKSNPDVAWESLLALLKNCPKLETLVFEGLHYKYTNSVELWEDAPTCLSSSPVKVLKVFEFGDLYGDDDIEEQIKLVKHLVATMPNLEQLILYYDRSFDEYKVEVSIELQKLTRLASRKCEIKLIPDNLRILGLSSTVPTTVSTK